MQMHEHHEPEPTKSESFFRRHRWLSIVAILILLYFLLIEHREHVWPYLPFIFLLACPLMHMFMHHGGGHAHRKEPEAHKDDDK